VQGKKWKIRILPGAPNRTCLEQLSDNEQFLDLVRFEQRSKLDELPADWKKVGRDVRFKEPNYT